MMRYTKCIFLLLVLLFSQTYSQTRQKAIFGEPTQEEFNMTTYAKDPEAAAVVLFESGDYSFKLIDRYVRLVKEIHIKIKVFNAKEFKGNLRQIEYYRESNEGEIVNNIQAITHNGSLKTYVAGNQVFDVSLTENWSEKRFSFANIKDGSILEYTYKILSPYYFNLDGWSFQNNLPTLYSELHTEIPGNYQYKRVLRGPFELYINEADIKKNCFYIEGYAQTADCDRATYAMKDIPAFKEEPYMLDASNTSPSVKYELVQIISINGGKTTYAKKWEDIDSKIKNDPDMGRQLKLNNYFENQLPQDILSIKDEMERAKAVYHYIQGHFKWNGSYRIFSDINVKKAYEEKSGNNSEINLALINALQAAGFDAKIALLSTRENGLPTQQYPVLSDFNFIVAQISLNNVDYFLDATDSFTPFGILPFRDLNKIVRVMDFKKGSYWADIIPSQSNIYYANGTLEVNDNGEFEGKINETFTGYWAVGQRKKYDLLNTEQQIKTKQQANENLEVNNFNIENQENLEKPYIHSYDITVNPEIIGENCYLYPFYMETVIETNPFMEERRFHPIDLGYPLSTTYIVKIDLKDKYEVVQLPKTLITKLSENDGAFTAAYDVSGTVLNIRLSFKLNSYSYPVEAYQSLKQFFGNFIKALTDEPVVLKKL